MAGSVVIMAWVVSLSTGIAWYISRAPSISMAFTSVTHTLGSAAWGVLLVIWV